MAVIQQTLKEALDYAQLRQLPQEGDVNGSWAEAVALVRRAVGGIQSYAVVRKNGGDISVVKDFGLAYQCSAIAEISKVYPLTFGTTETEESLSPIDEQREELESRIMGKGQEAVTDSEEINAFLESLQGKGFEEDAEPTSLEEAERLAKLPVYRETKAETARRTATKRGRPKSARK